MFRIKYNSYITQIKITENMTTESLGLLQACIDSDDIKAKAYLEKGGSPHLSCAVQSGVEICKSTIFSHHELTPYNYFKPIYKQQIKTRPSQIYLSPLIIVIDHITCRKQENKNLIILDLFLQKNPNLFALEPSLLFKIFQSKNISIEIIKTLIKCNINFNQEDKSGKKALHFLLENPSINIAMFDLLFEKTDSIDFSYVKSTCSNPNAKIDIEIFEKTYNCFTKSKKNCQLLDENGNSILHFACKNNNFKLAAYLIQKVGLNPNGCNKLGDTPLHLVCKIKSFNNTKIIETLLQNQANPNVINRNNITPMNICEMNQNISAQILLVMYGAFLQKRIETKQSNTLLHYLSNVIENEDNGFDVALKVLKELYLKSNGELIITAFMSLNYLKKEKINIPSGFIDNVMQCAFFTTSIAEMVQDSEVLNKLFNDDGYKKTILTSNIENNHLKNGCMIF